MNIADFLGTVPLLSSLDRTELMRFAELTRERAYPRPPGRHPGCVPFRRGSNGTKRTTRATARASGRCTTVSLRGGPIRRREPP